MPEIVKSLPVAFEWLRKRNFRMVTDMASDALSVLR